MSNPIAFNVSTKSGNSIVKNNLEQGVAGVDYGSNPGGLTWFNGADATNQYVIYSDSYALGLTAIGLGKPVCWGTIDKTDANVLRTINGLPTRFNQAKFTTIASALEWVAASTTFNIVSLPIDSIVTNGLILNFDTSQKGSYPGTGSGLYDTSLSQNNATLIGSPTYDVNNGGSLVFNGTSQYADFNASTNLPTGNNPHTLSTWVWKQADRTGANNWVGLANWGTAATNQKRVIHISSPSNQGNDLNTGFFGNNYDWNIVIPNQVWRHITWIFDGSTEYIYVNGSLSGTHAVTGTMNTVNSANENFGFYSDGTTTAYYWGRMAMFQIYNRALSATEVLQNYNASRTRFGL